MIQFQDQNNGDTILCCGIIKEYDSAQKILIIKAKYHTRKFKCIPQKMKGLNSHRPVIVMAKKSSKKYALAEVLSIFNTDITCNQFKILEIYMSKVGAD